MSDRSIKIEVCDRIKELSELFPDMRCAQLIAAVGELCTDLHGRGLPASHVPTHPSRFTTVRATL